MGRLTNGVARRDGTSGTARGWFDADVVYDSSAAAVAAAEDSTLLAEEFAPTLYVVRCPGGFRLVAWDALDELPPEMVTTCFVTAYRRTWTHRGESTIGDVLARRAALEVRMQARVAAALDAATGVGAEGSAVTAEARCADE